MPAKATDSSTATTSAVQRGGSGRWLLFVHQIPSRASKVRVRTWRRLQQMGAIAVKQAVYVLPDTPEARERFEWLKAELDASGADVSIFAADSVDKWSADALVEAFRAARRADYEALLEEIAPIAAAVGRRRGRRAPTGLAQRLERWQQRLADIERIDYFGNRVREDVRAVLAALEQAGRGGPAHAPSDEADEPRARYQGRVWCTRPRPGVDRMASAWLIRARIDPRATFTFAAARDTVPESAIPFDMYGVRFTHQGGGCTFETLCRVFGVREPPVERLAALVHALDLDDGTPVPPDGPTIQRLIEGLQLADADDQVLLDRGIVLFDALHRTFERQHASSVAAPSTRGTRRTRRPSARGRR